MIQHSEPLFAPWDSLGADHAGISLDQKVFVLVAHRDGSPGHWRTMTFGELLAMGLDESYRPCAFWQLAPIEGKVVRSFGPFDVIQTDAGYMVRFETATVTPVPGARPRISRHYHAINSEPVASMQEADAIIRTALTPARAVLQ